MFYGVVSSWLSDLKDSFLSDFWPQAQKLLIVFASVLGGLILVAIVVALVRYFSKRSKKTGGQ